MKKLVFIILLIIAAGAVPALAQEVQLNEDPDAARLFQAWVRANRANPHVAGWRVQILSSTNRQLIEEAKTRFRLLFPEVPADWYHEQPYYKLRVGAFRNRADAMAFIAGTLKDTYPGAYPAQDAQIHPREFLSN